MDNLIRKGNIYSHSSGIFRLRSRKGRAYEYEMTATPGLWTTTGTRNLGEALNSVLAVVEGNVEFKKINKITLKEFASDFFMRTDKNSQRERDKLFGKTKTDSHYRSCQSCVNAHILPKFGATLLNRITDVMIEDWYINVKTVDHEEMAPATRYKILHVFSIIMKEAKRQHLIDVNPCDTVERITAKTINHRGIFSQKEISTMFPDNIIQLKGIWGSLKNALYFSIMCDTGFRPGEVAGIRSEAVHNNGVYITGSIDARTRLYKDSIKTSKSGQAFKTGILSDYTLNLLSEKIKQEGCEEGFIFMQDGKHFNHNSRANKILEKALSSLKIPIGNRTQYSFRHTFYTFVLNRLGPDMSEDDIRILMGHTGYHREYDHRTPQEWIARMGKVSGLVNEIRG